MWKVKLRGIIPITTAFKTCLSQSTFRLATAAAIPHGVNDFQSNRQAIVVLDRELRRFGRIRTDHFTNALNESVEQKFMSAQHAVLLLRSLGSALSDEPPNVRVTLVQSLWSQLESLGVKPDVGLYNALLQTYIENDHFEQPSSILEKMKAVNITPNKVTYQRIIGLYCLKGDIDAASTVLNHMKNEGQPVNETLFAHLIHGHIRAGDINGAKSIFETMRFVGKAGIEPTAASFSMLMLGFAERGDVEAISEARKLADGSNCLLLPRDFIPAIVSLARNGHSDKISAVLNLITNHVGYNRDMMAAILQLCSIQKFQEAVDLFWTLRRPTPATVATSTIESSGEFDIEPAISVASQSSPLLFGRFLIRSLIKHQAPTDMVAVTMKEMQDRNINSDTALDAARISAEFGRADQFLQWLKVVHEEKHVKPHLRQHMFWPLFRILGYSRNTSVDTIINAVSEMKSMGVNLEHNSFVTLSEFILPAFENALRGKDNLIAAIGNSKPGILAQLEIAGYQPEQIGFSWLVYLAKRGLFECAKDYLKKNPKLLVSPAYCSEYLAGQIRTSEKALQSVVDILSLLSKNPNVENPANVELLTGRLLIESVYAHRHAEWPVEVIDAFTKAGLKCSPGNIRTAKAELERRNCSAELLARLDHIAPQVSPRAGVRTANAEARRNFEDLEGLGKMSTEQLESTLSRAKELQKPTLRVEKYLLMRYCQFGDVEKAEKLRAKLDSQNFVYPPSMIRALLTLAAAHKQSLPEALSLREKLEAAGGLSSPGAAIDIAAMQVKECKTPVDDILASLKSYGDKQGAIMKKRGMDQSIILVRPALRLVRSLVDTGNYKQAAQAVLTMIEGNFISPRCQVLGDICVNAYLNAKDWEGLTDLLEKMANRYKIVLNANSVLSALIMAGPEQKDKVQRCIDALSACQGEMTTLNALIVSLVECKKADEAQKVLETPGLRALPKYLSWSCENLTARGKFDEVFSLISVVRGLYNVDLEDMYFRLIKAYGRQSKSGDKGLEIPGWRKALQIYEKFEEESITPRPRTLRYLADILSDNNQPVPFEVPKASVKNISHSDGDSEPDSVSTDEGAAILKHVRRAVELLSRGQVQEVMTIRSNLDSESGSSDDNHVSMGTTFLRLLVQQLIDKHSHDLLAKLSSSLAAANFLKDLAALRDVAGSATSQPLPEWCWEKIGLDYLKLHMREGQVLNFVENINSEDNLEIRRSLPPSVLVAISKSGDKEAWDKVEVIIRNASGNGAEKLKPESMSLLNRFWTACILSKDLSRADNFQKDYPQLLEKPPLAGILRQVKALPLFEDAIPIFEHLLKAFEHQETHATFVLSYVLPMLASAGQWGEVIQRIQCMQKNGMKVENLRPFAINQIQTLATENKVELPSEIATLKIPSADNEFSRNTRDKRARKNSIEQELN